MEDLINYINRLTDELFFHKTSMEAIELYTLGGCYEFAKIIKKFVPDSVIYITNPNEISHCAIYYENKLYDATGDITYEIDKYHEADKLDIIYMEDCYGGFFPDLKLANIIIYEMKHRDLSNILDNLTKKRVL